MNRLLRRYLILCILAICCTLVISQLFGLIPWDGLYGPTSPRKSTRARSKKVDWRNLKFNFPISSITPLPTGPPLPIPQVQYDFPPESTLQRKVRLERLQAVEKAFLRSWKAYKKYAWLQDEVKPLTAGYRNDYGGWAATLVDNLDTLLIMGLEKEFKIAISGLKKVDFSMYPVSKINVFEMTIRHLGGLLSAHDISKGRYPILLDKAKELGAMLYHAFDTPNAMPIMRLELKKTAQSMRQDAPIQALVAEVGSLSLEFTRLSQLTGDSRYYDAVQRIYDRLYEQQNKTRLPGLWPIIVNARKAGFTADRTFTFGGMADSLYEYFPKQHILLGGLVSQYQTMYEVAIEAAKKHLFFRPLLPRNPDVLFSGTVTEHVGEAHKLLPEGQHLTCFAGGMLALGARIFGRLRDLEIAEKLTMGCVWAYEAMPSGVMPEVFELVPCEDASDCVYTERQWHVGIVNKVRNIVKVTEENTEERARKIINEKSLIPGFVAIEDKRYNLRPEAIESLFIMYRITGDMKYQEKAWSMFRSIQKKSKTSISYAGLSDVTRANTGRHDHCESFWMAETLKYLYLIFSEPSVVSLDEYVLNTEAHPLRRPQVT